MELRTIGRSDLRIAPLMLGGNVFGWTADEASSFAVLDAFVDAGFNAIDTADMYSEWVPGHRGGESETIIGKWLKSRGRREEIILATKVGARRPDWGSEEMWATDLSAAYIVRAVEGSLRRLQTDYIDLYQAHNYDTQTPLEETLGAFDLLVRSGKVRAIGTSHYDADQLSEALTISERKSYPRYNGLQLRYNLFDRAEVEGRIQSTCDDHGVGLLCSSSLAKGFLTGKYREDSDLAHSQWGQSMGGYLSDRGLRILGALGGVASEVEAAPGAVALGVAQGSAGRRCPHCCCQ